MITLATSCRRVAIQLAVVLFALPLLGGVEGTLTATSTISVDYSKIRRAIPTFLFGQNLQTIERGEGIIDAYGDIDQRIVELVDEAKVTTLRYPGGTAADFYHWWQALGPQSRRPLQSTGYLDEFYKPVIGPEEFVQISVALKAVPFVTANSGSGSVEEADAWANYFNSRGFPVTYWEVGNEIYFEGIGDNGLIGLPPDVYAREVIDYAAAIRQQSPFARIFAAAVIGPEEEDSFWNSVVLGLAGPYVDGISVHNAYFPLYGWLEDGTVPSDEYLYTAMLGGTKAVESSMTILQNQLETLGKLIPIFVTEYDGIFFPDETIEDPELTYARNPTLACALFNASVLHVFLRHERVLGAHHMSLAGDRFGSLVGRDGEVLFKNPQFYVHQEYAREAGRLVVESAVAPQDATFDSGPIELLSGQTGVPMLDAVATRDGDEKNYALFVVNRSLTHAVDTTVNLTLPSGVSGTVTLLDGPSYASKNDAQDPERVSPTTTAFTPSGAFSHSFPPHSLTIFRWTRDAARPPRPSQPKGAGP